MSGCGGDQLLLDLLGYRHSGGAGAVPIIDTSDDDAMLFPLYFSRARAVCEIGPHHKAPPKSGGGVRGGWGR